MLLGARSLLNVTHPLLKCGGLIGRNGSPRTPAICYGLVNMCTAKLDLFIGRPIEQTAFGAMRFNGKGREWVDKSSLHNPQRALRIAQHGNGVILDGSP